MVRYLKIDATISQHVLDGTGICRGRLLWLSFRPLHAPSKASITHLASVGG
jgi:hypothetical protein